MTVALAHGELALLEYQAALRSDFYSFMLRCFTDLDESRRLFAKLAYRGHGGQASKRPQRPHASSDHQHPAEASQIARCVNRPSGLAAWPRSDAGDHQRHIRAGALRQVRSRLSCDHDIRLVPFTVCDAARFGAGILAGACDDARRFPDGDLRRWRADRARRRPRSDR